VCQSAVRAAGVVNTTFNRPLRPNARSCPAVGEELQGWWDVVPDEH
jgi:hypothetical protein